VLKLPHGDRFCDRSPAEIYAALLDEGTYLASERTMYRILAGNQEVRERRNQLRRPAYQKPELLATGPNEIWTWDITKRRGPEKGTWLQPPGRGLDGGAYRIRKAGRRAIRVRGLHVSSVDAPARSRWWRARVGRLLRPTRTSWPAVVVLSAAYIIPTFVYLNRFLIPDFSFDTLNYHVFTGARGLSNFVPFTPYEFFPQGMANLPPFFDSIFMLGRDLMGYRLGTSLGLFAFLGSIVLLVKIARLLSPAARQRLTFVHAVIVLYAALNLELLFQLATYLVDTLHALVLMAGFYCVLRLWNALASKDRWKRWLIASAACYGLAWFGKITDPVFVVPELLTLGWLLLISPHRPSISWRGRIGWLFAAGLLTVAPVCTIWLPNFFLSGNPVYPQFNAFFHSAYFPTAVSLTPGTGGATFIERLLWPIYALWNTSGLAEPHGSILFSDDYKLTITWIGVLLLLAVTLFKKRRINGVIGIALFNYLATILLWSLAFGVERYVSFPVMLGGILLIPLADQLRAWLPGRVWRAVFILAITVGMASQAVRVVAFDLKYDMSWRPSLVHDTRLYIHQYDVLFDNSEPLPLTDAQLAAIQVVINCDIETSAYPTLTALKDRPSVNLTENPVYAMTDMPAYRHQVLDHLQEKYPGVTTYRFAAIAGLGPNPNQCEASLKEHGAYNLTETVLPSFLGYNGQVLELTVGDIPL
jgi:hypothetical protein